MGLAVLPWWGVRRHRSTVAALWERWSPGYDATADLAHLADALPDDARWHAALGYYRRTLAPWAGFRGPDASAFRDVMAPSRADLLFLHGDQDGCMHPELLAGAGRAAPHAQSFPGTGHFLHLEQPAAVGAAVRAFLGPAR